MVWDGFVPDTRTLEEILKVSSLNNHFSSNEHLLLSIIQDLVSHVIKLKEEVALINKIHLE